MSSAITPPRGDDESSYRTAEIPRTDPAPGLDRRDIHARQKEEFGGMKFGSAFFGWLAATGMAVLLSALAAGVVTAVGASQNVNAGSATSGTLQTAGLVGGIVLLVIILIAYFCGGYVAGRMARFSGVKQGVAVWLWAVIITVVLAVVGAIAGDRFNVLSQLQLPDLGVNSGSVTTAGILAAVGIAVVSLVGAILGGLSGMRFHRKVDKVGLG